MNAIINNQQIPLEIMSSPGAKAVGMMGRDSMDKGMLFPFEQVGEQSFHMKNCLIPLDIIFITGNRITNISGDCKPCDGNDCESYSGIGDKVLELPGGYCNGNNIEVGDNIEFI
tara:strand:+ start:3101 stop:3442 length:342 start_codon:yes stop_codon:yes gene_type:complete